MESLEYRGYDSAGVALLNDGRITVTKVVGRVEALRNEIDSDLYANCGIGHTRWATHGGVLQKNSHPHNSQYGTFSVVHNGIIENYQEIKDFLINNGYEFKSDSDTEVIPNLIEFNFSRLGDVHKAFLAAIKELRAPMRS